MVTSDDEDGWRSRSSSKLEFWFFCAAFDDVDWFDVETNSDLLPNELENLNNLFGERASKSGPQFDSEEAVFTNRSFNSEPKQSLGEKTNISKNYISFIDYKSSYINFEKS
jgi:hypothetical protein